MEGLQSIVITRRLGLGLGLGLGRLGFNAWLCSAWHGSMPGNHAQVGLIRLFGGRSSAARTTFSLNAWSYVVRFFLVREPAGDEVGVGINKGTFGPNQGFVADDA